MFNFLILDPRHKLNISCNQCKHGKGMIVRALFVVVTQEIHPY